MEEEEEEKESELVSWCFEPSQPQRITSGLKEKEKRKKKKITSEGVVRIGG